MRNALYSGLQQQHFSVDFQNLWRISNQTIGVYLQSFTVASKAKFFILKRFLKEILAFKVVIWYKSWWLSYAYVSNVPSEWLITSCEARVVRDDDNRNTQLWSGIVTTCFICLTRHDNKIWDDDESVNGASFVIICHINIFKYKSYPSIISSFFWIWICPFSTSNIQIQANKDTGCSKYFVYNEWSEMNVYIFSYFYWPETKRTAMETQVRMAILT